MRIREGETITGGRDGERKGCEKGSVVKSEEEVGQEDEEEEEEVREDGR